ncbi:MAG: hypothetical protein J0H69_21855 [Burkholderiales bacterium]|nr:hypothetical protein [Burkholderiales bacterium]
MFEFLAELALQLGGEWIGNIFHIGWLKATGRDRKVAPAQEAAWSIVTGIATAGITLLIFPQLALRAPGLQLLNLLLAPVAAGVLVERWRAWRESRRTFDWAVFGYAALFGVAFALTRFLFGG